MAKLLDDAYNIEKNVEVQERIQLVRRVLVDNEPAARVAEEELHRSSWWAYKWLERFDKSGLDGLKNKPRTGRPHRVPEEKLAEIKRELDKNPGGWKPNEVMNFIYKRTGIKYHKVHIYRLFHRWNYSSTRSENTVSNQEGEFKKG